MANGPQALAGLKLGRPSIIKRELIQSAGLTAKRDEDGVIMINPSRSVMAKPATDWMVHDDMEAGAGSDFETGNHLGGRVADASLPKASEVGARRCRDRRVVGSRRTRTPTCPYPRHPR